jgi:hypothetical protein
MCMHSSPPRVLARGRCITGTRWVDNHSFSSNEGVYIPKTKQSVLYGLASSRESAYTLQKNKTVSRTFRPRPSANCSYDASELCSGVPVFAAALGLDDKHVCLHWSEYSLTCMSDWTTSESSFNLFSCMSLIPSAVSFECLSRPRCFARFRSCLSISTSSKSSTSILGRCKLTHELMIRDIHGTSLNVVVKREKIEIEFVIKYFG